MFPLMSFGVFHVILFYFTSMDSKVVYTHGSYLHIYFFVLNNFLLRCFCY